MPIYISRGRFTSDAVKACSQNRKIVRSSCQTLQERWRQAHRWYLTFGHHDWMAYKSFSIKKELVEYRG
jgi:hypothetical protein